MTYKVCCNCFCGFCGFLAFVAFVAVVAFICGSCGFWFPSRFGVVLLVGFCGFVVFYFWICTSALTSSFSSSENSISGHLLKFILQLYLLDLCSTTFSMTVMLLPQPTFYMVTRIAGFTCSQARKWWTWEALESAGMQGSPAELHMFSNRRGISHQPLRHQHKDQLG